MKTKLMTEIFKWGVLTAIVAVAMPEAAFSQAADGIAQYSKTLATNQFGAFPYILATVCYVGGSFMMVSGALSLKKHAEAPASEPMGKGIARLFTGGAITSLPTLTKIVQESTELTGTAGASVNTWSPTF